jgi:hypothetical protein
MTKNFGGIDPLGDFQSAFEDSFYSAIESLGGNTTGVSRTENVAIAEIGGEISTTLDAVDAAPGHSGVGNQEAVGRVVAGWSLSLEQQRTYDRVLDGIRSQSGGPTGMGNDPLDPRGYDQRPGAPGDRTSSGSVQPSKTGPQYGSDTRTGGTGYVGDHPGPGSKSSTASKGNSGTSKTGGGGPDSGQAGKSKSSDGKGKSNDKDPGKTGPQPILLDLDGDGIELVDLSRSTMQVESAGDGLLHRTAWAGAGDGVLFIDADGNGVLSNSHEYVFTEWAGGASDDLDALRKVFDSNGDGKLTSADARWGEFRVLVTQADGLKMVPGPGRLSFIVSSYCRSCDQLGPESSIQMGIGA